MATFQVLGPDKIGPLSSGAGSVSIGTSMLTIGGLQYATSGLNGSLSGLTSNALYFIYAVISSGVLSLAISTNVNSVGPVGFTYWKLVGAFYASSATTVGSFVNIEGSPSSDWFSYTLNITANTPPTKGTVTRDEARWRRNADSMEIHYDYAQTSGGSAGSGSYLFPLPGAFAIDTNKQTTTTSSGQHVVGVSGILNSALQENGWVYAATTTQVSITTGNDSTPLADVSNSRAPLSTAAIRYSFKASVPITGWSSTPLKDL